MPASRQVVKMNKFYTESTNLIAALGGFLLGFDGVVKGMAISVVDFFNSMVSFTVSRVFPWEHSNFRPARTFALYTIFIPALIFAYKHVARNKGKNPWGS